MILSGENLRAKKALTIGCSTSSYPRYRARHRAGGAPRELGEGTAALDRRGSGRRSSSARRNALGRAVCSGRRGAELNKRAATTSPCRARGCGGGYQGECSASAREARLFGMTRPRLEGCLPFFASSALKKAAASPTPRRWGADRHRRTRGLHGAVSRAAAPQGTLVASRTPMAARLQGTRSVRRVLRIGCEDQITMQHSTTTCRSSAERQTTRAWHVDSFEAVFEDLGVKHQCCAS